MAVSQELAPIIKDDLGKDYNHFIREKVQNLPSHQVESLDDSSEGYSPLRRVPPQQ